MSFLRTTWPILLAALGVSAGCRRAEVPPGNRPAAPSVTPVALENPPPAEVAPQPARPAPPPAPAVDFKTFEDHVTPFLKKHCHKCHGAEQAEAKLRLDTLAADFLQRPAADHWVEVLDRLNLGEMPPEDEPRPAAEDLAAVTDWITSELRLARERSQSTGGRVLLRRLTRLEYANTVRDLLQVEFAGGQGPLVQLPPDGSLAGFDRVSKALLLDPSLMEAYLSVAQQVADQAIVFRPPLVPERTLRYEFEHTAFNGAISYQLSHRANELDGPFMVVMETSARTYGKLRHPYSDKEIPLTGRYRIRVRAAADPGERGEPVFMDVTYGAEGLQGRFRVEATKDAPQIYEFEKTFDAFTPGEFHVGIANGTRFSFGNAEWHERNNELTRLAEEGNMLEATRMKARLRAEGGYDHYVRGSYLPEVLHTETLPKLYLDWIEVIGPLQGEYPPPSMHTVFGDAERAARFVAGDTSREQLLDDARAVFAGLLPRAFRRPVQDAEVERIVGLVAAELEAGAEPP
ncbi:MAG TPA: DUF1587 domain-containing protein, partial [Pirellulaceae bacterium]|nr:DUF1587 domain-containing protein [Pirellulaceae bacterium]